MPRPQFTLKTLLWLMAVVAAFCAGAAWQRHLDKPVWWGRHLFGSMSQTVLIEEMVMPDGEVLTLTGRFSGWERKGTLSTNETQQLADEMQGDEPCPVINYR
jgi:hypothetical protein